MRVLGSWPPFPQWPDPPKTARELFHERQRVQIFSYYIRHANVNESLAHAVRSCWFLCRYGMQDYDNVITWPHSKVTQALKALGYWIEKEAPKTRAGPS